MRAILHDQLDAEEEARANASDAVRELATRLLPKLVTLFASLEEGGDIDEETARELVDIVDGDETMVSEVEAYASEHGPIQAALMVVAMAAERMMAGKTTQAMRLGFEHSKQIATKAAG